MRVTIVDLEWLNHVSFIPNPKCMKISSYYKQQHALVNFAVDDYTMRMDYDIMYVVRENLTGGPFPDAIDLLDNKVHLIGEGLKFYERYMPDIDDVMAACRPDYLLYPIREENKMAKADMVQFFHDGKLMPLIQDYHNAYTKEHFTYVIDEDFWQHSDKDIKKCYNKMKKDKHIVFSGGLDLDLIFQNKNKFEMLKNLKIEWREEKNVFITLDTKEKIDMFLELIDSVPIKSRGGMAFTTSIVYSGDHFSRNSTCIKDFYKYFSLIANVRKRGAHLKVKAPRRILSPMWFYFEDLEGWTTYRPYSSFVEYMTEFCCKDHNVTIGYLLNHSILWSNDSVHRMMYMWKNFPEIMDECGYVQWEEKVLEEVDVKDCLRRK